MELRELIISFVLVGLFVFLVIFAAIGASIDNGSESSLLANDNIKNTYNSLNKSLFEAQAQAGNSSQAYTSDIGGIAFGWLVLQYIVTIGKTLGDFAIGIYIIIFGLIAKTLGIPDIVVGVIFFGLVTTIIFAAWATYRQGR